MFQLHIHGETSARNHFPMYCNKFDLSYSTSTTVSFHTNLLADFLVYSLGFTREKALSTSSMVKTTLKPESNNPNLVIKFFEKNGINKSQIKTLVSGSPALLFSDVDKTLKPKFELLQELGLSESELASLITKSGSFFYRGIDTTIRPNLDYLRNLLHSNGCIVTAMKREPSLLYYNLSTVMPPNILLLQNLGFSSMDIEKLFLWRPRVLLSNTEFLANVLHRVENVFHIPRNSPMFSHGVIVFSTLDESNLERKVGIFRSFGWPDSDIHTMVRKLPYCLTSSEDKLRRRLKYFMKELGFESSYLASHPTLLKHDFEKRIVPRNDIMKVLKEKQLMKSKLSLYSVVACPEEKFLNKYVLPFRDEVPEVYDIYMKSR